MVEQGSGQNRCVGIRRDPSLASAAGLLLVSELDAALGMMDTLYANIGSVMQRRRRVSGGERVMSFAEMMLVGGDFMCDLDDRREDTAGARLRTVAQAPGPTTAGEMARRLDDEHVAGIEVTNGEVVARAMAAMAERARARLEHMPPTTELDPTDVEVYGLPKDRVA